MNPLERAQSIFSLTDKRMQEELPKEDLAKVKLLISYVCDLVLASIILERANPKSIAQGLRIFADSIELAQKVDEDREKQNGGK